MNCSLDVFVFNRLVFEFNNLYDLRLIRRFFLFLFSPSTSDSPTGTSRKSDAEAFYTRKFLMETLSVGHFNYSNNPEN